MCGVFGIVHLNGAPLDSERDVRILRIGADQIAHRGPDDEQYRIWQNVGIAFRRLSIVDVDGGRQPLENEQASLLLVNNGEIYNHRELRSRLTGSHRFSSQSDCEIILHLYEELGLEFVNQLNGMFALALVDKRRKRLTLARDRLGIKPLYFYRSRNLLVFGSEVKAVLAHPEVPKEFDWETALTYRSTMFYPQSKRAPISFFKGIQYLPGGDLLEVDLETGEVAQRTYWDPVEVAANRETPHLSRDEYVQTYRVSQVAFDVRR